MKKVNSIYKKQVIVFALLLLSISFFNIKNIYSQYSAYGWGDNQYGQLGNGTTEYGISPTLILKGSDCASVACGEYHTVAIKTDGSLWTWGENSSGQLGDGTFINKTMPVKIGTDTDWGSVYCGYYHTIAIKTDGSLWAWGDNRARQLGDGTTDYISSPIHIGTDTDWAAVSCGIFHTIAIKTDGSIWAWGNNCFGQLGDGTTTYRFIPTQIGTDTDWASVACGSSHTTAIKTDGSIWAWGDNCAGQLGDGTNFEKKYPIQIGTDTNWTSVACGKWHTIAIKKDGTIWGCGNGYNDYEQLGDSTDINRIIQVQIGTDTDWASVACEQLITFALKRDGTLWAWGNNISEPFQVGTGQNWRFISAGGYHSIGLREEETEVDENVINRKNILYPNPANDYMYIDNSNNSLLEKSEIQVYNMLGEMVLNVSCEPISPIKINVQQLSSGVYFVRMGKEIYPFVKE